MMEMLPDHPDIARVLREGLPEAPVYHCPVCGAECEELYVDSEYDVVGCPECVKTVDAADKLDEEE